MTLQTKTEESADNTVWWAPLKPNNISKRKENFALFKDHNGSLLKQQPGAESKQNK